MAKISFDIKYRSQIESGEYKVETREGRPVRIICWDKKEYEGQREPQTPIVYLLLSKGGCEHIMSCTLSGLYSDGRERDSDLFIITPEPELSEFEKAYMRIVHKMKPEEFNDEGLKNAKENAAELLVHAREQFIKDGYIIEKKAFQDAVEKIDDTHKAEMSVEYSLHCKVENGTRHAVINWNEFQKVAQHFIDCGKAEALRTRATELTENLIKSGLDKDSIPYHLIEFMCNLYTCQNWKEIEATAEAYTTRIKAAALKDLPRWRPAARAYEGDRLPRIDWSLNRLVARFEEEIFYLDIRELYKLPGFKED